MINFINYRYNKMDNFKSFFNPSTAELYKIAIQEDDLHLSDTGALLAYSGTKTGRSPKDKRVVLNDKSKNIWWGDVNIPIDEKLYLHYKNCALEYLEKKDRVFKIDAFAGWDFDYKLKIRIYCTSAYHALFMKNMLIPVKEEFDKPDFTIINVGELQLNNFIPENIPSDNSLTDTLVGLDFEDRSMIIYGTQYAGEMKKGILTLMMYEMPLINELTLHSSANMDKNKEELCIFFGLSGTGKTTLSADPSRYLIGDDEHVWHSNGVFNIEGGCYAKCIGLKKEYEPEIYNAIKYGSVVENVVYFNKTHKIDFEDGTITQNTRCSYPLEYIPNVLIPAKADIHPKNIVLLTCDAFGVLPPVSKLTPEQAVYFFVNGYTSKVPGTEIGVNEPQATFSSCFGEPFLIWHPLRYGELLKEKIEKHDADIWMLNTGWIKGPYGTGHRISIKDTRTLLNNIHNGSLAKENYETFPYFNIDIPKNCQGIDNEILNPSNMWTNKELYDEKLKYLYDAFENNYKTKILNK